MSEIRVDTISEKTSANGVAVDGVTLKDGQVDLADSKKILLGTGDDLQLYHDGSHSYIQDEGTGDLKITTNGAAISLQKGTSETLAYFATDSGFNLYHDNVERIGTTAAATVFNETGVDIDFRVESNDNSGMFHINAGANHVSVGTDGDLGGVFNVSGETVMRTTGNSDTLTLVSTDIDASIAPTLNLSRNNNSAAANDFVGKIDFTAEDAANNQTSYANIQGVVLDATDGSEDGRLRITSVVAGTNRNRLDFLAGETVFNEDSIDLDFRVESNGNANMIFVDGGNDHVNIGTSTDHGAVLNVESTDNAITLLLASTDTDANAGPQLKLFRAVTGATNDICGKIEFGAKDDAGNGEAYALISQKILNAANGSEEARLTFQVMQDGAQRDMLSLDASEVVINEDSRDIDFRVESNGNANMLFVDGGENRIGIGMNTPADTVHIRSGGDPSGDIRLILEPSITDGNCALDFRNSASTFRGGILYDTDDNTLQFKVNTTEHFRIAANGDLLATDTSIGSNSDSRLKQNIADYTYDISKFKQFKAKTFDWKNPTQHNNATGNRGFIAQEVAAIDDYWTNQISIDPDTEDAKLIDADSDGNHMAKTLKLGKKDAMYISVIQQLITRIEALEG